MLKTRRTILTGAAGLLTVASLAMATPAFAVDTNVSNQPNVIAATQGSTTQLNWTVRNDGPQIYVGPNGTITFNAPAGTTFPAQATVPASLSNDGGATYTTTTLTLNNCTVGGGGAQLTCATGNSAGTAGADWQPGVFRRFAPTVNVSPTAAIGTFSAAASFNFTDTLNNVPQTINNGTLDVQIVPQAEVPMIDPIIGGGAAALALGAGAGIWATRRRNTATA